MRHSHTYQLVLQFAASSLTDYDAMSELEDQIIAGIGDMDKVDGHDMGCGEFNIFVHTNNPKLAFDRVTALPVIKDFISGLKAGFRKFSEDNYTAIYPPGLDRFIVM